MITKYGNGAVVQIATVFERVYHVACQRSPLKRDFLDKYLSTFSGVRNLANKSAMKLIFFLQMFKISCRFRKRKKKVGKKLFVFEIIASELVASSCLC